MRVRPFVDADRPLLVPLLRGMGFAEHADDDELLARALQIAGDTAHALLVADADGDLVGYAWAQDYGPHLRSGRRTVRLHDLFVRPDARRTGIGRALFETARTWAAERGASWLEWQASPEARAFYERLGVLPSSTDEDVHPFYEIAFERDVRAANDSS